MLIIMNVYVYYFWEANKYYASKDKEEEEKEFSQMLEEDQKAAQAKEERMEIINQLLEKSNQKSEYGTSGPAMGKGTLKDLFRKNALKPKDADGDKKEADDDGF